MGSHATDVGGRDFHQAFAADGKSSARNNKSQINMIDPEGEEASIFEVGRLSQRRDMARSIVTNTAFGGGESGNLGKDSQLEHIEHVDDYAPVTDEDR